MDTRIVTGDLFDMPTALRAEAIVHGGAADLRLWPGAGPDRTLLHAYGVTELRALLDGVREKETLPVAQHRILRLHPGKLRADALLWIVMHDAERNAELAPAPSRESIATAADLLIRYAADRSWTRIAFPPLGWGPGEVPAAERIEIIARTSQRYFDECVASGRAPVLEHVYVVTPDSSAATAARRALGSLAKAESARDYQKAPPAERAAPSAKSSSSSGAKKAPRPASGSRASAARLVLDHAAVENARVSAEMYEPKRSYNAGDWMQHRHFGVGQVQSITPDGFAMVLFEDKEMRRLLAGRGR